MKTLIVSDSALRMSVFISLWSQYSQLKQYWQTCISMQVIVPWQVKYDMNILKVRRLICRLH